MRERQPEHPHTDIPISIKTWYQLLDGSFKSPKEDWEIATEAVDEWVRRHNPDAIPMPAASGYQWKGLFLPTGTLLRTVFGGKNHHCTVEADQILYNGKPVSPSGFVNAVGGIRRNAWRCTWILFPDSKDWKLADTLRHRERARRPPKPVADPPATPPCAAPARLPVPPVTGPVPEQVARAAASASEGAIDKQAPQPNANAERRKLPQDGGITLSPPRSMCGTGRRMNGDDGMAALLRQHLLPLLYRVCAFDAIAPESHASLSP